MEPLVLPRSFEIDVSNPAGQGTCATSVHEDNGSPVRVELPSASYGLLVHQLRLAAEAAQPRGICVGLTSASPGEGVTTNCFGLAAALAAQTSRSVLLVDADSRYGRDTGYGPVQPSGPEHIPISADELHQYVYRDASPGVWQLSAARCLQVELPRGWHKSASFVVALQSAYTFSVLDLPPVSEMGAEIELARHADGVLLVVEVESGDRQRLISVTHQLERWGIRPMGVLLNKCQGCRPPACS